MIRPSIDYSHYDRADMYHSEPPFDFGIPNENWLYTARLDRLPLTARELQYRALEYMRDQIEHCRHGENRKYDIAVVIASDSNNKHLFTLDKDIAQDGEYLAAMLPPFKGNKPEWVYRLEGRKWTKKYTFKLINRILTSESYGKRDKASTEIRAVACSLIPDWQQIIDPYLKHGQWKRFDHAFQCGWYPDFDDRFLDNLGAPGYEIAQENEIYDRMCADVLARRWNCRKFAVATADHIDIENRKYFNSVQQCTRQPVHSRASHYRDGQNKRQGLHGISRRSC